jgi:hypothetical protein
MTAREAAHPHIVHRLFVVVVHADCRGQAEERVKKSRSQGAAEVAGGLEIPRVRSTPACVDPLKPDTADERVEIR